MKKAKQSKARNESKSKAKTKATAKVHRRITAKTRSRIAAGRSSRQRPARIAARPRPKRVLRAPSRSPSGSAATMAARVMANRNASKAAKAAQPVVAQKPVAKSVPATSGLAKGHARRPQAHRPARPPATAYNISRQILRMSRAPQFTYMKAPGADSGFDVGDAVEVFCDHERDSERVRGWIKGVVVQVDNKLVAVQFRSNVFLTDGWMVPDRILWYSLTSEQIRAATLGKKGARKIIPDY
jgi:hypothetical protein